MILDMQIKKLTSSICLQEIDFNAARSFGIDQMEALAQSGRFVSGYRSINWDKRYVPFPYWPPSNHFGQIVSGQALLSHHEMVEQETIILKPNSNAPAWYLAFYLDRLLQITQIDFLGTPVVIMNAHLQAFDKATRLEQIKTVKQAFEKYASDHPVILMGDFNSEVPTLAENGDAIDLLMETAWISSAIPFEVADLNKTFSSETPERMIDYIFYNSNHWLCIEARVLSEAGEISDHLPVIAKFKLK